MINFQRFFEHLLGIDPPKPGEATVWHLRFEQPWPPWITVLFLGAAVALIVWLYRREGTLASLPTRMALAGIRISLVVLAVLMLFEAVLSVDRTGLPYLVLMIDDSESMKLNDHYNAARLAAAARELSGALAGRPGESAAVPVRTGSLGNHAEAGRLDLAKAILLRNGAGLLDQFIHQRKLRLYRVANSAVYVGEYTKPAELEEAAHQIAATEPTGDQTRLGDAVRSVLNELRGTPPAAIVLVTDGNTTAGEPLDRAAEYAASKNVPLFTVGLGDPEEIKDLDLHDLMVDDVVYVDDLVTFQATLTGRGFKGQTVPLRLRELPSNTELASTPVRVGADGQPTKVQISFRPTKVGAVTFQLAVDVQPNEVQKTNNAVQRKISVRKEKIRVLLVDSAPRYEFRFLKNLLERDPSIDLKVFLEESDPEFVSEDRAAIDAFPTKKEDLFHYDVVIFGDVDPSYLGENQLRNLVDFVREKGGGFLMEAGERFAPLAFRGTPIEAILPIQLEGARNPHGAGTTMTESFHPRLTPLGEDSPMFRLGPDKAESLRIFQSLPGLFWYFEAPRTKPTAEVLAEHPTAVGPDGKPIPLIAVQYVGLGRSLFCGVNGTWRWRYRVGDRYFARFWVQTIRFLSRSKLVGDKPAELTTDRRDYLRGQPVQVRVRFVVASIQPPPDGEVKVVLERRGHEQRSLALRPVPNTHGIWEGTFGQAHEGNYHLWLASPTVKNPPAVDIRVTAPPGEFERVQMNQPELERAAQATEGKFYTVADVGRLAHDLPVGRKVPLDTDPPIPLWNTWPVFALFMTLIVVEWVWRKRKRML